MFTGPTATCWWRRDVSQLVALALASVLLMLPAWGFYALWRSAFTESFYVMVCRARNENSASFASETKNLARDLGLAFLICFSYFSQRRRDPKVSNETSHVWTLLLSSQKRSCHDRIFLSAPDFSWCLPRVVE